MIPSVQNVVLFSFGHVSLEIFNTERDAENRERGKSTPHLSPHSKSCEWTLVVGATSCGFRLFISIRRYLRVAGYILKSASSFEQFICQEDKI